MKKISIALLMTSVSFASAAFAGETEDLEALASKLGKPTSVSEVKAGSTIISTINEYKGAAGGKDLSIIYRGGKPVSATVEGSPTPAASIKL